jgi:hypothetical protein
VDVVQIGIAAAGESPQEIECGGRLAIGLE